ncbi:MAG: phosphoribosylformylglycinamidine synthase subunit PurS [Chloroflexi bacterium]|nr:phosphoribosylformylglycinamidine synthase subunit PurS [Chloroflexota bacterium]
MRYKAEIHVTLKRTVNDPQGLAIRGGLHSLGYESVESVRAGKFIEVWLEADSEDEAQRLADEMSDQLLANPVIEDYSVAIGEGPSPQPSPRGRGS